MLGAYYDLFDDMSKQKHVLIAGRSGSGKSVVINGIIHRLLFFAPGDEAEQVQFILIDTKLVELGPFKRLPHTIKFAGDASAAVQALQMALDICNKRFAKMERKGLRQYPGGHVYVIIDELADLLTVNKKEIVPVLQRVAQLGRAANVHIIAATQCPLREILPTKIRCNFDAIVALKTTTAQDSRNITGGSGADRPRCEDLPPYGKGYYITARGCELYQIPKLPDEEITAMINHWHPVNLFKSPFKR